jgi:bifunctional aspartokinase / homoserine dehydrogenase 1
MSRLVMKFGGTSVGSVAAITELAAITSAQLRSWDEVAIVVSAMSGVTDMLIHGAQTAATGDSTTYPQIAKCLRDKHFTAMIELVGSDGAAARVAATYRAEIERLIDEFELLCRSVYLLSEASARGLDEIASLGERMCARVVAATLQARGMRSEAIDATEILCTTAHFGNALPLWQLTRERTQARLNPLLAAGIVPVITGYIGATADGVTTTLGRGGSDYSGAIIGAALNASEVMIYTDVDGVMTADPRLVPSARVIAKLSYTEMGELAYFGAKVLHPRTIRPLVEQSIPLRIRNTFNPEHMGTLVLPTAKPSHQPIKAITAIHDLSLILVEGRGMIGVPGIAARTFGAVATVGASVLMISQASSEQSICFVVLNSIAPVVMQAIEDALTQELLRRDVDRIIARNDMAIITAVGAGMRETPGCASRVFGVLGDEQINVIAIAQGSSDCSVSIVIRQDDADATVRALHPLTVE